MKLPQAVIKLVLRGIMLIQMIENVIFAENSAKHV
jgi:hypothetical protein